MNQHSPVRAAAATDGRARFTTAEFLRMTQAGAFEDMKVELVEGELERMTPPMNDHATQQAAVVIKLGGVVPTALIRGEVGIDLGGDTVMAFDAAVLAAPLDEERLLHPDDVLLAIEIAISSQSRDMTVKRLAYARAGIAHYWVVDGRHRVAHVYADPVDGDYIDVRTVRFGAPLEVPGTDRAIVLD